MRSVLAIFMALHGVAHLVGFAVPWGLVQDEEVPFRTTILDGRVDLGADGIRIVGLLWLALAVAFIAASFATWTGREVWLPLAAAAAGTSLLLSLIAWPDARLGVLVNVILLLAIAAGSRLGWL